MSRRGSRTHLAVAMAALVMSVAALQVPATAAGARRASACDLPRSSGDVWVDVTSGGVSRPFLLYVPRGYDGRRRLPLLLNLHGTGDDGPGQMELSSMRRFADRDGFAVAAPSGGADFAGIGSEWVVPGSRPVSASLEGSRPAGIRTAARTSPASSPPAPRAAAQDRPRGSAPA